MHSKPKQYLLINKICKISRNTTAWITRVGDIKIDHNKQNFLKVHILYTVPVTTVRRRGGNLWLADVVLTLNPHHSSHKSYYIKKKKTVVNLKLHLMAIYIIKIMIKNFFSCSCHLLYLIQRLSTYRQRK